MSRRVVQERDPVLGHALRGLEVPDHDPAFWAELRRRLETEAHAPAVAAGRPVLRRRPIWLAAAGAAAAAAAIGAVALLWGGTAPATAAQVRARVLSALATTRTVSGILVARQPDGTGQVFGARWHFALSADGSLRIAGIRPYRTKIVYDAVANVESYAPQPEAGLSRRTGIAPGVPDSYRGSWIVQLALDTMLRSLAEARDAPVRTIDYHGRPAWFLRFHTQMGDIHEVTVDRASGFPVRELIRLAQGGFLETDVQMLRINQPLPADTFRAEFPRGADVAHVDDGFRRVDLAKAAAAVGYPPLVPSFVPQGFALNEVAVAPSAQSTGYGNPESKEVVSVSYRRGLQQFVVTTRLIGARPGAWTDPVVEGDTSRPPQKVVLARGELAGRPAHLLLDPSAAPHLWSLTDTLVVTVAGDLDAHQLMAVAESLHRLGSPNKGRSRR